MIERGLLWITKDTFVALHTQEILKALGTLCLERNKDHMCVSYYITL